MPALKLISVHPGTSGVEPAPTNARAELSTTPICCGRQFGGSWRWPILGHDWRSDSSYVPVHGPLCVGKSCSGPSGPPPLCSLCFPGSGVLERLDQGYLLKRKKTTPGRWGKPEKEGHHDEQLDSAHQHQSARTNLGEPRCRLLHECSCDRHRDPFWRCRIRPDNCRQGIAARDTRCRCGSAWSSEHLGRPFGTPTQQAEHPRPLHSITKAQPLRQRAVYAIDTPLGSRPPA